MGVWGGSSVPFGRSVTHATKPPDANGDQDPGSLEDLPGKTKMGIDQSEGEHGQGNLTQPAPS